MELCFVAGRWRGQVDLEEHFDNESYFDAFLGALHDKKTNMPLHTVANVGERPVRVNLRSDEWRNGVKKTTEKEFDKCVRLMSKLFFVDK